MIATLQRIALRIWCATPSHWLQAAAKAKTIHEKAAEVLDTPATAAIGNYCNVIVASEGLLDNTSDSTVALSGPSAQAVAPAERQGVQHGL